MAAPPRSAPSLVRSFALSPLSPLRCSHDRPLPTLYTTTPFPSFPPTPGIETEMSSFNNDEEADPLLPPAVEHGGMTERDQKAYRTLRRGFYCYTVASEVRSPRSPLIPTSRLLLLRYCDLAPLLLLPHNRSSSSSPQPSSSPSSSKRSQGRTASWRLTTLCRVLRVEGGRAARRGGGDGAT